MQKEYFSSFESSSNDDSVIESIDNKIKIRNSLELKNFNFSKYNHLYKISEPKVVFKTNCSQMKKNKTDITVLLEKINEKKSINLANNTHNSHWMYLYKKLFINNKEKSFNEIFLRFNRIVFSNRISEKMFEEDSAELNSNDFDDRFVMYLINKVQYKSNFLKTNSNYHLLENIKKLMTNKQNNSFESLQVNNKQSLITETKFKFRNSMKNETRKKLISKNKKSSLKAKSKLKEEVEKTSKIKKLFNQIQKLKVFTTRNDEKTKEKKFETFPSLSINNTPSNRQVNTKETELKTLNLMTTKESSEQFSKNNAFDFNKTFEDKAETVDNKNKLEIVFFQKLLNSKVSKIKQSSRFLNEILFDIVKQEYEKKSYNTVYQDNINKFLYSNVVFKDCKLIIN